MLLKQWRWSVILLPCMLCLLVGCSSDEENPVTPTPAPKPPAFELRKVTFPQKMLNSTDTMAKMAISLVTDAMSFEGTGCVFEAPKNAKALAETKSAWEYSWEEGGVTKRLAITLLPDLNKRKWQVYITGMMDGVSYDNWLFMDAAQLTDLSSGNVTLNIKVNNRKQLLHYWTWRMEGNNYLFEDSHYKTGVLEKTVLITINSDNSGSIERKVPIMVDLRINWDKEGNGMWSTYENGVPKDNGSWN